ncbi:Allantoicase [Mycoemilia scoparia]|uniref:Allantoicase n=1 Tax=Mycoemilia scoparia TaxID=417184 RepID=A0A9W8DQH0_9FUNG|nr:Allantoicase [Mycoemilia scoparia]
MSATYTFKTDFLTPEAFAPYGQVIQFKGNKNVVTANQGTAKRANYVANLVNERDGFKVANVPMAEPNMCIFSSQPRPVQGGKLDLKVLERHPHSTQVFVPIKQTGVKDLNPDEPCYIVVVADNGPDDKPVMSSIKAFVATGTQGINYNHNTWHSPMVCINKVVDFLVLVWENKQPNQDTQEVYTDGFTLDVSPYVSNVPSKL